MRLVKGYGRWLVVMDKKTREALEEWYGPIVEPIVKIGDKEFVVRSYTEQKELAYKRAISIATMAGWYIGAKKEKDIAPIVDVRVIKNQEE